MSAIRIQPAIMSGGSGTRLWPMSRRAQPKQFLALIGEKTLFQETVLRVGPDKSRAFAPPLIIAGEGHLGFIERQLADIGEKPAAIIIEPAPRNTAAVAAVAALWAQRETPDALILLLPADHHVADPAGFRAAVEKGAKAAAQGAIVTFGVKPVRAETGFGYIESGKEISPSVFAVKAFREKPDLPTAMHYVEGGAHYWNAGIFLFSPKAMLEALDRHAPAIKQGAAKALDNARRDGARINLDRAAFEACPADSVDYAVMEKIDKAAVVGPVDIGWNDVGSWSAVEKQPADSRIIAIDSDGAVIHTTGPCISVIGAGDFVVVATGDAVLVAPKDRAQEVKKIVEELKARGRTDLL